MKQIFTEVIYDLLERFTVPFYLLVYYSQYSSGFIWSDTSNKQEFSVVCSARYGEQKNHGLPSRLITDRADGTSKVSSQIIDEKKILNE